MRPLPRNLVIESAGRGTPPEELGIRLFLPRERVRGLEIGIILVPLDGGL